MSQINTAYLFKALDHLGYIVLFLIGYYFIHEGNVIGKFQQKKTNFAATVENITEYPTIVTWIEYNQPRENLILGRDFNISISLDWNTWINLEEGQNYLNGDFSTIFYLEEIPSTQTLEYPHQYFRITPKDYTNISQEIFVKYNFSNSTMENTTKSVAKTGIVFTTQNNSRCGYAYRYDGDSNFVKAFVGERKWLTIHPEKYMFIPECREKPYFELVLQEILQQINLKCNKTCRDMDFWICNTTESSQIPVCEDTQETYCFWDMEEMATKVVPQKPCTKLQYGLEIKDTTKCSGCYSVLFIVDTDTVAVKEEYVIYDMLQLIGAIGGTLGLCIGFSFKDVYSLILGNLQAGLARMRKNSKQMKLAKGVASKFEVAGMIMNWKLNGKQAKGTDDNSLKNVLEKLQSIENEIERLKLLLKRDI